MNKTTIYFKYGAMNSGKSLDLIKVAYNYKENNINSLVLKPEIDTRAPGKVYSRTNLSIDSLEVPVDDTKKMMEMIEAEMGNSKVILVDEANFLSPESIDCLVAYVYDHQISTLMFFGLKVDFKGKLFPGSKRIVEIADKLEETTSICWCGKKARQNGRAIGGKLIKTGDTVLIDNLQGKSQYITLCNYHFYTGQITVPKD